MTSLASAPLSRARRFLDYFAELWRRREFAVYLGLGNLKARNASTVLGVVWWALNPLLLGGVYFLIFGVIFPGRRPDDFLAYLLSGMFVFHFTSHSMTGGANSVLQNSKLLSNLRFPRLILPISNLIEATVGFVVSLGVFYAIAWPLGQAMPNWRLIYLPAVLALHLVFNLGLASAMARLAVPFRDINNLIPYVSRIWLYVTPIIWPLEMLDNADPAMRQLVELNPMFHIVSLYRSVLFGNPIHASELLWTAVSAVVVGVVGVAMFIKYEGHIVRYL